MSVKRSVKELDARYQELFDFLTSSGFECSLDYYRPDVMGGFVVECRSPSSKVRVTNDRSQIFIELAEPDGKWHSKEDLLEGSNIPFSRHPSIEGLWTGYDIDIQTAELKQYLPDLLRLVRSQGKK